MQKNESGCLPHTIIQKLARNDRHLSAKTIELVEENIEVNLHDLELGNGF